MITESIKSSIKVMQSNKVRTFLTALSIVISIAVIIVVYSAGEGIKRLVLDQVESFGTDVIQTEIKIPSTKKGAEDSGDMIRSMAAGVQITTLTLDDLDDVTKQSDNISGGYAGVIGQERVAFKNESERAMMMGVSASYIDIDQSEIDYGHFFSEAEDRSLARVLVLGSKIKEKLFGDEDALNKMVKIRGKNFKVIGVLKERGAIMTFDFDEIVYTPIRTMQKRIIGVNYVSYMVHKLNDVNLAYDTAEEIRYIVRQNHKITNPVKDDFRVTTMTESIAILDDLTNILTLLLIVIISISLVVGGVGVMNIMYVVVSERTPEIGLRKAVGAKQKDIIRQFLIESTLITLFGGVVGIVLGILMSLAIYFGANAYGLDWTFVIPVKAFVVALVFSIVFGVIFGFYPAKKASELDPITALRNE